MSRNNTSDIYSQVYLEQIIKGYLSRGVVPTLDQIEEDFNTKITNQDLNSSNFTSEEWSVERKEESSASKYNETNQELSDDFFVLFRSLYGNSERAVQLFNKWQLKEVGLENRISELEAEIDRLLLIEKDTAGYFNIIGDRFTDTERIDLDKSYGLLIDLEQNQISLNSNESAKTLTRVFANRLLSHQVGFNNITRNGVISSSSVEGTEPVNCFLDTNLYWKASIVSSNQTGPITIELNADFKENITLSRLEFLLIASSANTSTYLTPLYSLDGISWNRFAAVNTSISTVEKASFVFPETSFRYLKVIMEKQSSDYINEDVFIWDFGIKHIKMYKEEFDVGQEFRGQLISKPLFLKTPEDEYVGFNKLACEVCENITESTRLYYYLAIGRDIDGVVSWITPTGFVTDISAIEDGRSWFPISPINSPSNSFDNILELSKLAGNRVEDIGISFDSLATTLVSPGEDFNLLTTPGGVSAVSPVVATDQRYHFTKPSHKLLNLQISTDSTIDLNTIKLWRNVGQKGILNTDTTQQIRRIQAGWEFDSVYYSTVIKVSNSDGLVIDVGTNPVILNGSKISGVLNIPEGTHSVKVHKNNWKFVTPELDSLEALKQADPLYPFNQKLLIEGYLYGTAYPTDSSRIYVGADIFAGHLMDKVSIYDMLENVEADDFSKFALDLDISGTSPEITSRVILVNVDNSLSDFINEKYMLEFNLTNQLFNQIAFKAEFITDNSQISPVLDEYKIKLSI